MRTNKNGDPAIPKLCWKFIARAHHDFAKELFDLLRTDSAKSKASLHKALNELIEEHDDLGLMCSRIAEEIKPGHPPKEKPVPSVAPKNYLVELLGKYKKKRLGRPPGDGPKLDRVTFQMVKQKREELAEKNGANSIKAAIDAINSELARKFRKNVTAFVDAEYHRVRSAYGRGKKLSEL